MKKTVLITGATGGIGLAFTKLLAKKEYRLLLVSSSEKRLQHLKELLLRVKPNLAVEIYAEDLAVQGAAGRLYDRIGKDGWQVDVLINNAGFGMVGAAHTLDMEKEEQMLQLLVVYFCPLISNDVTFKVALSNTDASSSATLISLIYKEPIFCN